MTYFLTPQAYHDLENIHEFIANDKPKRAQTFVNLLEKKCELLSKNPSIGKRREELSAGLRSYPVKKYVIFYRQKKYLEIIRVLHGARDIINIFEKDTHE